MIDPTWKDVRQTFENEFSGMTTLPVTHDDLIMAREKLIAILRKELTNQERRFLLSVKEGGPQWDLLGIEGIERLPGIQWKLKNVKKMDKQKHSDSLEKLKAKLGL